LRRRPPRCTLFPYTTLFRSAGYPQGLDGGALQYALVLVRRLDAQHRTDRARFLQRAIRLDDQQRAVIAGDQAQHLVQHHVDHLVELERARERRQDRVQGIQPVADVVGEVENQQEGVFVWQAPDPHAQRMDVIQTLVERDDHLVGKVLRVTEVRLPAHFDGLTL